jgi:RNA polymerase sigma-70 factor (ECF subfamily)
MAALGNVRESEPRRPSGAGDHPAQSDEVVVAAARRGDTRAARAIWERYVPMVARILRRFFGTAVDNRDLAQEVFLRVFRRLGDLADPATLPTFVAGICLGVARNELRRRRIRSIVRLTAETDQLPAPADADEATREAVRRLYGLLDGLGAQDRSLFVSRYIEQMELKEVAAAHAMSFATTRRRLDRMTRRVAARMRGDDVLAGYVGQLFGAETEKP